NEVQGQFVHRRAGQTTLFLTMFQSLNSIARQGGVGRNNAVQTLRGYGVRNGINLRLIQVGRDFHHDRHVAFVLVCQLGAQRLQGTQQAGQLVLRLQRTQVLRVGRGDVHSDVISVRVDRTQTCQIVLIGLLNRG